MPSDTRYTDEQVEVQAADREAWGQTDAAAMLRALLADRARVEAHRAALLAEVRAWRYAKGTYAGRMEQIDAARAATDALLGAEVQ